MKTETFYEVEFNRQVLHQGEWDSEDCVWDWAITTEKHKSFKEAEEAFNKATINNDVPLIRLWESVYDMYGCKIQKTLLDERAY